MNSIVDIPDNFMTMLKRHIPKSLSQTPNLSTDPGAASVSVIEPMLEEVAEEEKKFQRSRNEKTVLRKTERKGRVKQTRYHDSFLSFTEIDDQFFHDGFGEFEEEE